MSTRITCDEHGENMATYVCGHIAQTLKDEKARGFLDLIDDQGEHQAICTQCNTMPFEEWKRASLKGMKVICWDCYQRAADLNGVKLATKKGGRAAH